MGKIKLRIHFFMHVPFEGPEYIAAWAKENHYKIEYTRFYNREMPPSLDDLDVLIIMGGPMGVYDENKYPWLKTEKEFIRAAIESGKNVIGICLGAQLIADALGGKVKKNPEKEIGWFPVRKTKQGLVHSVFNSLPNEFSVFHWHSDTFEIPVGAQRLLESDACENQVFIFNGKVLGLQFHMEVTKNSLRNMLENGASDLSDSTYVQSVEDMISNEKWIAPNNQWMKEILDKMVVFRSHK